MTMKIDGNDELLTPRDLRREFNAHLDRLDRGEVEKLVLMHGTDMKYVVLPVKAYEDLTEEGKCSTE
jgi:hypothetical protein